MTVDVRDSLRRFRQEHDVPGVAVCSFTAAGPDVAVADGVTSVETGHAMSPDTVFRIYSITKMLTATVLVTLAAEGVLDLDRPVDDYVPGLRRRTGEGTGGATLRHLLSHRSGLLPDAVTHDGLSRDPAGLAEAVRRDYARTPVLTSPGQFYGYSNLGVSLAGLAAQEITGTPFAELMRQRLFAPTEMTRSTHDPMVAMTHSLAQHHLRTSAGLRVEHDARAGTKHEPSSLCYSTVVDMARFGALHLRSGLEAMHKPHSDPRLDIDLRYGLGCYLTPESGGVRQIGHEGFLGGMWAKLILDPARGRGVVWMDNRGEELRERRYETMASMFDGLGRIEESGTDTRADLVTARDLPGEYVRTGAPTLKVSGDGENDLELRSQEERARLTPYLGGVWRSSARFDPGAPPWGPHAGTRRIALGTTVLDDGSVPVVHLNGLPYVRREWRDRVRDRRLDRVTG
ncbi:serine hydrolase domain-containing protein [Amycolatopsis sp. NPDC089917]|uniref:serine hydrolase domain-containing protein n=1 Tax=Amycolatopsis sp. NPDC089917 TaxID=3155187 RepID=UPI00344779A6